MDAVLGTAGHIDHGKTSLVRALTGINCDRLDEEKRRGITIELGFAWLDMPDGRRLGIVDVPGHEKFVRNMVAGAAGIDCMLLIVAADEGVMPQTREHLDICALLGVRSGLVVLTKTDMVDAEWLEMAREDVQTALQGTFLEKAPILPVSSTTGAGLPELRDAIFRLVDSIPQKPRTDILRLPVDRVFTLKGFGTVVTGTLISGECSQGEDVSIMPTGLPARARTLQVHGAQVKQAHQSQRCAINMQGAEVVDIRKGDVIARPDTLFPSRRWIVSLTCLPSSPHPLKQRMEAHFHHGAKECIARIVFRDRDELAQGESALAEIHFSEPMVGIFGDHCVLRAHSPLRTIAGGRLIDPLPPLLRKRDPLFSEKMDALKELAQIENDESTDNDARLVTLALNLRPAPGIDERTLAVLTALPRKRLAAALTAALANGDALCWDQDGRRHIGRTALLTALTMCGKRARELHEREPLKAAFAHNAFCSGWGENLPQKYIQAILDEAVRENILEAEGNGLKLAGHEVKPDSGQSALIDRLLTAYKKGAFAPPTLKELDEEPKQALAAIGHLCATGRLTKVQEGLYYDSKALGDIIALIRAWFSSHDSLEIGDMKTIADISRKHAIPLLEYMDALHLTVREGNRRRLNQTK